MNSNLSISIYMLFWKIELVLFFLISYFAFTLKERNLSTQIILLRYEQVCFLDFDFVIIYLKNDKKLANVINYIVLLSISQIIIIHIAEQHYHFEL